MMTTPIPRRLALGQIDSLIEQTNGDNLIGQILYVQDEHLLVVPLERHHTRHWCAVLADLDGQRPDRMNVATADLEDAWRTVDPGSVDPDMHMIVWHARLAVALWRDPRWHIIRDAVRIARVPGAAHIAMYHQKTVEVVQAMELRHLAVRLGRTTTVDEVSRATGANADTLRKLLDDLVAAGFLQRVDGTPAAAIGMTFGAFHTIAEDLRPWSPVRAVTAP